MQHPKCKFEIPILLIISSAFLGRRCGAQNRKSTKNADPAWFAFIVTLSKAAPFTRDELIGYLNTKLIETRNLFAGNITKQPGFMNRSWRIAEHFDNTNYIMDNTFFLGTYPGLTKEMFDYAESVLDEFLCRY